jgi:hypothetical protein
LNVRSLAFQFEAFRTVVALRFINTDHFGTSDADAALVCVAGVASSQQAYRPEEGKVEDRRGGGVPSHTVSTIAETEWRFDGWSRHYTH